jgi:hypothetical protein
MTNYLYFSAYANEGMRAAAEVLRKLPDALGIDRLVMNC